jgi:hypothetical protein
VFRVNEHVAVSRSGTLWCVNANLPRRSGQGDWEAGTYGEGQMTWTNARAYCEALEIGGFSDWRLPTSEELQRLFAGFTPAGFVDYGVPFESYYWSSTEGAPSKHFRVRLTAGSPNTHLDDDSAINLVWPVRP